jgi:hypothetical protein
MKGTSTGPISANCSSWNWESQSTCCSTQTSCADCLSPSLSGACSFCQSSSQCQPRSSTCPNSVNTVNSCFGSGYCPRGFGGDCQNRTYQERNVFQSQLSSTPTITFDDQNGGVYFFEIHLRIQTYSDVKIAEFDGSGDGFALKMRSSGLIDFVIFCGGVTRTTLTSTRALNLNELTRIAVILYSLDVPQCGVGTASAKMYFGNWKIYY